MSFSKKDYINKWITKAQEDKLAVIRLSEPDIVAPSIICFHCQQMVEKYLKAYLLFHDKEILKTHNIEYLLNECALIDQQFADIDPVNLSDFGVNVRYPGDIYIPSSDEVIQYKIIALEVERSVLDKIF